MNGETVISLRELADSVENRTARVTDMTLRVVESRSDRIMKREICLSVSYPDGERFAPVSPIQEGEQPTIEQIAKYLGDRLQFFYDHTELTGMFWLCRFDPSLVCFTSRQYQRSRYFAVGRTMEDALRAFYGVVVECDREYARSIGCPVF